MGKPWANWHLSCENTATQVRRLQIPLMRLPMILVVLHTGVRESLCLRSSRM